MTQEPIPEQLRERITHVRHELDTSNDWASVEDAVQRMLTIADAAAARLEALEKWCATLEPKEPQSGVALIAAERERQVQREGWTHEHDDSHRNGEMAMSAARYALHDVAWADSDSEQRELARLWPWESCDWKPKDPIRNLARAGALIAAELDRRLRAGATMRYQAS